MIPSLFEVLAPLTILGVITMKKQRLCAGILSVLILLSMASCRSGEDAVYEPVMEEVQTETPIFRTEGASSESSESEGITLSTFELHNFGPSSLSMQMKEYRRQHP